MNCRPRSSPAKRILVITSTFPRWEGDRDPPFVFELCRRLLPDFRVQILAPHAPGAKVREDLEGLEVYRFRYFFERGELLAYGSHPGGGGILANLKRQPWCYALVPFFLVAELASLVRLLGGQRFDLIHAHWLIPQGLMAVLAARISRSEVPLVCTSHGADLFALRGAVWERIKKHVLASSKGLTVVSRIMGQRVLAMSDKNDKIRVIPMGVDLERQFVPLPGRRRSKSLLFVGRMVEKKGLRYLLEAMPIVLDKHPDAFLVVAGSGPEEAPMRRLAAALRLMDHVRFAGALENKEIPALYQASELVVFPSVVARDGDQEGFGLVLVEAMGCECAVIATDLPAIRDIVVDDETGLIVPEKDPVALAQKIVYLLDNPHIASSLARAGRNFVLERYDWHNIAAQYEAFFVELMEMGEHQSEPDRKKVA